MVGVSLFTHFSRVVSPTLWLRPHPYPSSHTHPQASSLPSSGPPFQPPCGEGCPSTPHTFRILRVQGQACRFPHPLPQAWPPPVPRTTAPQGRLLCVLLHLRCHLVCPSVALVNSTSSLTYPSGSRLHHQLPEEGDAECFWKGEQEKRADQPVARNLHSAAARVPDFCRGLPGGQGDAGTEPVPAAWRGLERVGRRSHLIRLVGGHAWLPGLGWRGVQWVRLPVGDP